MGPQSTSSETGTPSELKTQRPEDRQAALRLRPAHPADEAYILDSWIRSYLSAQNVRRHRRPVWKAIRHDIERLLMLEHTRLSVLCERRDPDKIAGWVCFSLIGDTPIVHYVLVRKEYEEAQPFWRLLSAAGVDAHSRIHYTFDSKVARRLAERFALAVHFPIEELIGR